MPSAALLDIAAMADTDDLNHQAVVDDLVEDPIVADAHPVDGFLAYQGDAARWPRLIGQKIYIVDRSGRALVTTSDGSPVLLARGGRRAR